MKIETVTFELIERAAQPAFRWRDGLPGSEPARVDGVLAITTTDGASGRAYTRRGVIVGDIVRRRLADELIGQDPLAREWLWHRIWEIDRIEEMPIYALGLVDTALWDLAARLAGLPAHRYLGSYRDSIPAYASTVTYETLAEYLDIADQCLERGFTAIKLHAWGDPRRDAELAEKLREHVGPDVDLMYDGSAGFDLADAVYVGRALSAAGYRWYEEPMREFSIESHKRLADRVEVPLLVAETSDGAHWNVADYVASGCAGYVRTEADFKGGVTGAMRVAHLAESYGLRAEVHGMGPVNRSLCMAIPNSTYYEALVHGNPVATDPCVDKTGVVHAPAAPGFDWDAPASM